jgi:hypothetical protein
MLIAYFMPYFLYIYFHHANKEKMAEKEENYTPNPSIGSKGE